MTDIRRTYARLALDIAGQLKFTARLAIWGVILCA